MKKDNTSFNDFVKQLKEGKVDDVRLVDKRKERQYFLLFVKGNEPSQIILMPFENDYPIRC